jgi:hypothetical protein
MNDKEREMRDGLSGLRHLTAALLVLACCCPGPSIAETRDQQCASYAARAVSDVKKATELGCSLTGARWTANYNDHFNWCKGLKDTDLGLLKTETDARQSGTESCRVYKKVGDPRTQQCASYASRAVSDVKKATELGCSLTGARWTVNYNDHFNWCKGLKDSDLGLLKTETDARQAGMAACHQKAVNPPSPGKIGGAGSQPCPQNKVRYADGTCGCPSGMKGPNCDVMVVH